MKNVTLQIVNEEIDDMEFEQPGNGGFVIDSDEKAEWALTKIREERAEAQRIINVCNTMIEKYQARIEQTEERLQNSTAYLESQLMEYFETVPHKKTKTQEKYVLPSGVLKKKYLAPQYIRDEDKLVEYLESSYPELVEIKKKAKWEEFKKRTKLQGDKLVDTETGEIVNCVTVQTRPPVFEIEV